MKTIPDISPQEKIPLDIILRKHNISIDDLIECGKRGLNATKITKDRYGDVVDEQPDLNTQHKFFQSFMELLGYIKSAGVNVQVVNLSAVEKELLDAYRNPGVEIK